MLAALRQPKWIISGLAVLLLAALFIRLGFWQLSRLEERRLGNEIGQMRLAAEPMQLDELLVEVGNDTDSLEYRYARVSGSWDVENEVLIRNQVELGNAGFHVITPLVTDDGTAVLVNRGWVPLPMGTPPVEQASPVPEAGEAEGWVHLSQQRPPLGPEEPEGEIDIFNRVDIDRIGSQMPYELAPVYLVATGEGSDLPITVDPPDFSDEGPHLGYAIQWFAFAVVGLVGFYFLFRRKGRVVEHSD